MADQRKPWEHAKGSSNAGSQPATDPLAERFVSSLAYDRRLYKHDIQGSIAHARMLQHVELITEEELQQIEVGLRTIEYEIDEQGEAWGGWKVELEDVHMCIEAALIEKTGDAGRKLHTGRSRNDQVATDLMLWLNASTDHVFSKVSNLLEAFMRLAERYGHVVMPGYTHLQRAQPIVVGGEIAGWIEALCRTQKRLDRFRDLHACPLGSGAIAGSSLSLDREWVADQLLGDAVEVTAEMMEQLEEEEEEEESRSMFADSLVMQSSIDSTASRDAAVDFVYALAMASMTLSRWAEQWILYASQEFRFITLDDRYTTGSSMMPQKQNPDMLELIRGKTGGVYGSLIALLTMLKGLPIGYNRDLQEDKKHVFEAYDTVCDCLGMATHIVQTTRFNEERIKAGLDRGYLDATSLAEYLVTKGVAFRSAHQVVGKLVHQCEQDGLGKLAAMSVERINALASELDQAFAVVEGDVYDWLGPENVVRRYQTAGNAGLSGFEQQLAEWREWVRDE